MHGYGMPYKTIYAFMSFKTRGKRPHYSYIKVRSRRRAGTRPLFYNRNAVPVHQRGGILIGICVDANIEYIPGTKYIPGILYTREYILYTPEYIIYTSLRRAGTRHSPHNAHSNK